MPSKTLETVDDVVTHEKVDTVVDIVVVGAGMVGASAAAALSNLSISTLVIDKVAPSRSLLNALHSNSHRGLQTPEKAITPEQPDIRVSALSQGSVNWLTSQGIWQHALKSRITPYKQLSVNETSGSECTFSASDINQTQLGCFIENTHLQQAALKQAKLEQANSSELKNPDDTLIIAEIESCLFDAPYWHIRLSNGTNLKTKLIIAADGANSHIRSQLGFNQQGWQYAQHCYSALVKLPTTDQNHSVFDKTWQTFENGQAIAFLPLFDQYASLIVYQSAQNLKQLSKNTISEQQMELEKLFYKRLPEFTLCQSAVFPLQKMSVLNSVKQGVILLGDAAHTIHPLAGQGVNLGIKDLAACIKLIAAHKNNLDALHSNQAWQSYLCQRNLDVQIMSAMMDMSYFGFNNPLPPVKWLRNQALSLVEHSSILKRTILKVASGV